MRYPKYQINKSDIIIYQTRDELILYEMACRLESQILKSIERKDLDIVINKLLPQAEAGVTQVFYTPVEVLQKIPEFLRNQTPGHVYIRCLHHVTGVLETKKHHERAVQIFQKLLKQNIYCQTYRGKWVERVTIDLHKHLKKPRDALIVLINSLYNDPHVKLSFRYTIYWRAKKLEEHLRENVVKRIPEYEKGQTPSRVIKSPVLNKGISGRNIFTDVKENGDTYCISVEEAALKFYKNNGYPSGIHTESTVYHALYNLFMWDIIYADVLDAFRNCHQSLPRDLIHETFYEKRKDMIDKRLDEIMSYSDEQMAQLIDTSYKEKFGISSLINWNVKLDTLQVSLT